MNPIPPLDFKRDPIARGWSQPDPAGFLFLGDSVLLHPGQISALYGYDSTLPTGVYPGKCWKRDDAALGLLLMWYGFGPDDSRCSINYRKIIVRQPSRLVAQDLLAIPV